MRRKFSLILALTIVAAMAAMAEPKQKPTTKIDINSASIEQLTQLPGIGTATARRIIDFRLRKGPFRRPQDLMAVHGIGARRYKALKDWIVVK